MRTSFLLFTGLGLFPFLSTALPQRGGGGGGRFGGGGGDGGFTRGGGGGGNAPPATASAPPPAAATTAAAGGGGGGGNTGGGNGAVSAALIPPYGITAGVKANDGTANCVGDNGKAIPCTCPPSVDTLVPAVEAQVGAGQPFPTGTSAADQLDRLNTCILALQNFQGGLGSGVGCPIVSTTWTELRTQLQSEA